jgi:hypothetical protein
MYVSSVPGREGNVSSYSRILKVEGAYDQSAIEMLAQTQKSYLDRIPIFSGEGVLGPLLETFLAFRKALVPM